MAAQKLGIKAKIVMPAACPAIKVCRGIQISSAGLYTHIIYHCIVAKCQTTWCRSGLDWQ